MDGSNKIVNAAKWSVICEVIAKIISPITTIVLARLLSQEIFGIIASITAITSMADLLADAGFNAYVIQHQFKSDRERFDVFNICFWTNLGISMLLFVLIILNRDLFSQLVGASGYGFVLSIAALVIPLTAVSAFEMAILKKELKFKRLGIIRIVSKTIPFVCTIPLAILSFGYWSLVCGSIVGELVGVCLCLKFTGFIPSLSYNASRLRQIFSFSIWAYLESILEWLLNNIPMLTLASIYGVAALGVFKVGLNLVSQITNSIYALYSNVYKSAMSREQNNQESFKNIFLKFQWFSSIFCLPLGVCVYLFRDCITAILLGSNWQDASIIVGLWGLMATCSITFGNFYSDAIRAKGHPCILVVIDAIYLIAILVLLYLSSSFSFYDFCVIFCLLKGIQPLMQVLFGMSICRIHLSELVANTWPQVLSAAVISIPVLTFDLNHSDNIIYTISIALCCVICYFGLLFMLDKSKIISYIKQLKHG